MKTLRVAVIILCASSFALAANPEFKGIVRSIEQTYGVHHMHIPMLGVAMFFVRPAGVHSLKMAIFEGFQTPTDSDRFRRVIESSLGPDWRPFVRVETRGETNGETTMIYMNPSGGQMRMVIVNIEPSEAVVLQMNLSDGAINKWLKEPGEEASTHHHHHYTED